MIFQRRDTQTRKNITILIREAFVSGMMMNLITGVLMVKLALELGAGPIAIGLIGAFPFLGQIMQIPSVYFIGKKGLRKLPLMFGVTVHRSCILALAVIPWVADKALALKLLIVVLAIQNLASGWSMGPWNGWVRDLLPAKLLGRVFGSRLNLFTMYGTLVALVAAFTLDAFGATSHAVLAIISGFFGVAFVCGIISFWFLSRLPEVPIGLQREHSVFYELYQPLKDGNFRRLIVFLLAMLFSMNLAVPFFPAYMLDTLHLPITYVMGIWALGQFMQVPAFKWWGMVSDKYSHTTSLAVCLPFFVIGLALWPLTTLPEKHAFTLPILVVIHLLVGVGLAGIILSSQVIALKLAPKNQATSYVAAASMLSSIAAGVASVMGGVLVSKLKGVDLTLNVQWSSPEGGGSVTPYAMEGYDFLFVFAALLMLFASPLLAAIVEKGKTPPYVVSRLMRHRALSLVKGATTVVGLRQLTAFPIVLVTRKKRLSPLAETFEERRNDLREELIEE